MIKPLCPDAAWHPKRGAPLGNRNALKSGRHTNEMKDLAKRIADWRRRVRAVMSSLIEMEKADPLPPRFRRPTSGVTWAKRYGTDQRAKPTTSPAEPFGREGSNQLVTPGGASGR